MAMAMDMDMDMATMDTMARGLLRPSLDMVIMVMDMVLDMVMDMAMVTMDIMARDLLMLSQLPLLSQAMDIMVMDMVMDTATDMDMVTTDTMARDQLMLNQVMDTMGMDMAMDMDIMVRQEPSCCCFLEFSTTEVDQNRSSQKQTHFLTQGNKYL